MIDMPDLSTPRGLAKFVVTTTIQVKTSMVTRQAIADHSSADSTNLPVVVVGAVVGMYVSGLAKPYTDKAVDKTFDFVIAKRDARRTKKSQKTETQK